MPIYLNFSKFQQEHSLDSIVQSITHLKDQTTGNPKERDMKSENLNNARYCTLGKLILEM